MTLIGIPEQQGIQLLEKYMDNTQTHNKFVQCYYERECGSLWQGDARNWLGSLPSNSVDLIFADPPYNIKKASWDVFESQEEYIRWTIEWIRPASAVLKSTGSLFVCGFSEILADIKHPASKYFNSCRWLVWHYKNKANLGKDWGRSHESMLHFRKTRDFVFDIDEVRIPYGRHTLKYPGHPQAETSQYGGSNGKELWLPNPKGAKPKDVLEIPTTSNGMKEKTKHPTQKPEELLRKIVLSSSKPGDLVIDPFVGSGTTIVVAEQLKRKWMGCDISREYLNMAKQRVLVVPDKPINYWKDFDRANEGRRKSIR